MRTYFYGCFVVVMLTLHSCGGDDVPVKPPPTDPCAGKLRTSADFTIKEILSDTVWFFTDTVFPNNSIEFEAIQNSDEYVWKVGDDERTWTTKKFRLNFIGFIGTLPIHLIVKNNSVDTLCNPGDDGIDTVTKYLTVVGRESLAILGSYKGYNLDNPSDTFTVTVRTTDYRNRSWVEIININKGCFDTTNSSNLYVNVANKGLTFTGIHNGTGEERAKTCWSPSGTARLYPDNNHLVIHYKMLDQSVPGYPKDWEKTIPHTF
ncbi:MAG: hypothetical protein ACK6DA_12750 [Candidatus Kapaibacterium sp.]